MHHQDGPFLRPKSSASKPSDPGLGISASSQSPAGDPLSEGRGGDHRLLLQKIEAERDDSQTEKRTCLSRNCSSSSPVRGTGEEQQVSTVRGMESTGDSTSIWSSLDLDGHSHKGESFAQSKSFLLGTLYHSNSFDCDVCVSTCHY